MIFGDSADRLKIYHWVKKTEKDKITPYMKFNVKPDIIKYTNEEYEKYIEVLNLYGISHCIENI